jgi:hypothetical protein
MFIIQSEWFRVEKIHLSQKIFQAEWVVIIENS